MMSLLYRGAKGYTQRYRPVSVLREAGRRVTNAVVRDGTGLAPA
jgi:hypothetical protein